MTLKKLETDFLGKWVSQNGREINFLIVGFFFNVDIIVLLGMKQTENSRINVISCANSMSGKILVLKLKSKMLPVNQITASFD